MRVLVFLAFLALSSAQDTSEECTAVELGARVDCGISGSTEDSCHVDGCCWIPAGEGSIEPWCFYPDGSAQVKFF